MKSLYNYLRHPKLFLRRLLNMRLFYLLKDEYYLKLKFFVIIGKKLNLDNPQTFNEKIQWLKLHNRNPQYTKLVDKYEVKKYVTNIIGQEHIIPTLGIYKSFNDIDFNKLPNQFVIKCTHDSGGVVICKDKEKLDIKKAKYKINKSLKRNYYYQGREWPYKNVKPRIIIEKYMEDEKEKEIIDYKVMVFNGDPKIIFTCTERHGEGLKVTFFDLNWEKMPFERHYPASKKDIQKPINFDKMLEFSKILAKDMPFVRMDFYEINGKLYFGEYTFYPGSGLEEFTPEEYDKLVGSWINLENLK